MDDRRRPLTVLGRLLVHSVMGSTDIPLRVLPGFRLRGPLFRAGIPSKGAGPRLGLGRRVDVVDIIDYVNTSTCVKCVDASQRNNMAAPSESMEAPGEEPAVKTPRPRSSKVWE